MKFALLPILEKLMGFINNNALPIINAFSGAFSLNGNGLGGVITTLGNIITSVFTPIINGMIKAFGYVRDAIGDNLDTFKEFGALIATYVAPVIGTVLGGALQVAGKIAGGVIDVIAGVVKILNGLISGAVAGINALISAYNAIPFLPNVSKISTPTVSVPTIKTPTVPTTAATQPRISKTITWYILLHISGPLQHASKFSLFYNHNRGRFRQPSQTRLLFQASQFSP